MIFDHVPYRDEEYVKKKMNLKSEKDLKGDDIHHILIKKIKKMNYLYCSEKNIRGVNENPFDLIVGDEKNLELYGFEIKGDTDNYSRLKTQLQSYIFTFNEVFLVLHKKEKPEWLPNFIGVIRVFEDGSVYTEDNSWIWDLLDISTDYEWETLFRMNGLGVTSKMTREVFNILGSVRKNVSFNRFFGVQSGLKEKNMSKFYPFTDEQKKVLIGFDVPYHYKQLKRDIVQIERKLQTIKEVAKLGLQEIQEQLKEKRFVPHP